MAAAAKLQALKEPPIRLIPFVEYDDYASVRLVHTHTPPAVNGVAQAAVTRKYDVPFCPDSSDKERLIRTLHEFIDACVDSLLHCHDADRYSLMRSVLGGDLRANWDTQVTTIADADKTDANFNGHIRDFLRAFLPSNAFTLQKTYLANTAKPFFADCYSVAGRLRLINLLSPYLPGSGNHNLFTDATELKNGFYNLMLPEWQLHFDSSGNRLDDANYTLNRLVDFMEVQRLHHNASQSFRRYQHQQRFSRGRFHLGAPRSNPYSPYPTSYSSGGRFSVPSPPRGNFRSPNRHSHTPHRFGVARAGRGHPGRAATPPGRTSTPFRSPYQLRSRPPSSHPGRGFVGGRGPRRLFGYTDRSSSHDVYFAGGQINPNLHVSPPSLNSAHALSDISTYDSPPFPSDTSRYSSPPVLSDPFFAAPTSSSEFNMATSSVPPSPDSQGHAFAYDYPDQFADY